MGRARRLAIVGFFSAAAILLVYIVHESVLETRLPARPGGALSADVSFGSGLSFHRGSLEVRSHDADDVLVVTKMWGWGKYAVDVHARERGGDVQVEGRVEGPLHWIFAGPTVDVQIFVPNGYGVEARVDGGPLVLEDLSGPVEGRAAEGGRNHISLRRSAGVAKLVAHGSSIRVDDVDGALKVETVEGDIEISDVTGTTVVTAQEGADISIADARGNVHVASEYGHIRLKDVVGALDLETEDGSVRVSELDGRIRARSRHGDIDVDFRGNPSGSIETEGGSIEVEVPASASFDLDATSQEDAIELDRGLDFVRIERPEDEMGPLIEEDVGNVARLSGEIAAEVHEKLSDRIRRYLAQRRRGGDGGEPWREDWNWSWDDPDWRWHHHEWGFGKRGGGFRGWDDQRDWGEERVTGAINGGGDLLELRSQGGRIRLKE